MTLGDALSYIALTIANAAIWTHNVIFILGMVK